MAELTVQQPSDSEPLAEQIARYVRTGIRDWDAGRGRSRQTRLGPSSLGHPCLRHLAYYATQAPKRGQKGDPFPAITGTWGHSGMDLVFGNDATVELGRKVEIGPELVGTYDAFFTRWSCVADYKFMGKEALTKIRSRGPTQLYRVQVHSYGFGLYRLGYEVRHVALVCLPRSGFLSDIYVWTEPFDLNVVEEAFQRWYTLKEMAPILVANPSLFTGLARADGPCTWCPWWAPELAAEHPELACQGAK